MSALVYKQSFLFAEGVSEHLASDNGVVEILLKHATNDELSKDVKQNAAICLAKLATSDKRYKRANYSISGVVHYKIFSHFKCDWL